MNKIYVRWFLGNSLFLVLLYFAVIEEIAGAGNLLFALTWLIAGSLIVINQPKVINQLKTIAKPVVVSRTMHRIDLIFDISVLSFLIFHGWWFTALGYAIHIVALNDVLKQIRLYQHKK